MPRIERPQNARSDRTRTAVLDATWRLLEDDGAEAVTMERVAGLAGTSRRAVYLHFGSRADLFLGLFHHINEQLDVRGAVRPIEHAATPDEALAAWAALVARVHSPLLPAVRALDAARRTDPAAAAVWDRAMAGWLGGTRGLAEMLAARGRLAAPWTVDSATDVLWALMGVELIEDLVHDRGWTVEAYENALRTLAQRTLLTPPTGHDQAG